MHNGTLSEIDFLDKADAIDYARVRKMGQNKAIRRHIIKEFPFSQWLKNKGLYHG
jgi:hypothetical protein